MFAKLWQGCQVFLAMFDYCKLMFAKIAKMSLSVRALFFLSPFPDSLTTLECDIRHDAEKRLCSVECTR